jgi:transcriptional regulator with XRE-family HTH domain
MSRPSGADLKAEREAADILGIDLAAAMGVHQSRISQIEGQLSVTPRACRRYREALASLQVAKTSQPASVPTETVS